MIYKLLSLFILLSSCVVADTPKEEDFLSVQVSEFPKYFNSDATAFNGSELVLNLSDIFLNQARVSGCSVSATIDVFNAKDSFASWEQMTSISLIDLTPEVSSKQKLYVAGLGKELTVRLSYIFTSCQSGLGSRGKLSFRINVSSI